MGGDDRYEVRPQEWAPTPRLLRWFGKPARRRLMMVYARVPSPEPLDWWEYAAPEAD